MSPKARLFVEKYLTEANLNAAKAARLAGYSRKSAKWQGYQLLAREDVKAAIKTHLESRALTAEEALYLLSEQARGTVEPFLYDDYEDDELKPRGTLKMDTDWAKENVHLIKEISQNSIELEGGFIKTTTKLKLHDSQAAIVHLMRAHGLFKDYGADFFKFIDVSQLNANQLQRLSAGENILSVLLKSDPDDEADEGEVEDDLPPALPMPTAQSEKKL